jgi:replication fork clamp-binding protein CrfC
LSVGACHILLSLSSSQETGHQQAPVSSVDTALQLFTQSKHFTNIITERSIKLSKTATSSEQKSYHL